MSTKKKKKVRKSSVYSRQMIAIIDEYKAVTGRAEVDQHEVATWAIANGKWTMPKVDVRKKLARDLAIAAREDYIQDDNGEPVRRRHAYKLATGNGQQTLWVNIENATPTVMKLCVADRRRGIHNDVGQLDRDMNHYNKHYNPGAPIQTSFNFTEDMEEKSEQTEYIDQPPDDLEDDNDTLLD